MRCEKTFVCVVGWRVVLLRMRPAVVPVRLWVMLRWRLCRCGLPLVLLRCGGHHCRGTCLFLTLPKQEKYKESYNCKNCNATDDAANNRSNADRGRGSMRRRRS